MFTFALILFGFAVLCIAAAILIKIFGNSRDARTASRGVGWTALGFVLVAIACLIGASYNKVPTQNVGIVTVYGKPTGETTGAGVRWLAPWKDIQDWDSTRQSYNHLGDKCEKPGDGSLWVTISGQRQACIRVQINWQTTTAEQAVKNWSTYKAADNDQRFDTFVNNEVDPGFNDALLSTFKDFDPLTLVAKDGTTVAPDLAGTYTGKLETQIDKRLGATKADTSPADISVRSINWGLIGYDDATQKLISQYAQKILEGRNLEIDKTNAAVRQGIAKTTGIDPAVQQCLDQIRVTGRGEPGLCVAGNRVTLTKPVS